MFQDHFGVMALFFLDLVGFDSSCPGPVTATTGSAFGPDYAHHKGSAFGIYACGFDFNCQRDIIFQQLQPGDTAGLYESAELTEPAVAASTAHADAAVLGVVLAGLLVVVALAGLVAMKYKRSAQQKYQPVGMKEPEAQAGGPNGSQQPNVGV